MTRHLINRKRGVTPRESADDARQMALNVARSTRRRHAHRPRGVDLNIKTNVTNYREECYSMPTLIHSHTKGDNERNSSVVTLIVSAVIVAEIPTVFIRVWSFRINRDSYDVTKK